MSIKPRTFDNLNWSEHQLLEKAYERLIPAPTKPAYVPPALPKLGNVRAKGFKRIAVEVVGERRQDLPTISLTTFTSTSADQLQLDIDAAKELVDNLLAAISAAQALVVYNLAHDAAETTHDGMKSRYLAQRTKALKRALPSLPNPIVDEDEPDLDALTKRLGQILNPQAFTPAVAPSAGADSLLS